jgi:hypothetical protein
VSSAAIQHSFEKKVYFLSAAAAIAINSSAGRSQPDADDAAALGAGNTGAGAGLPAKAHVAAIANAVTRATFSFYNFIFGETSLFRGTGSFTSAKRR